MEFDFKGPRVSTQSWERAPCEWQCRVTHTDARLSLPVRQIGVSATHRLLLQACRVLAVATLAEALIILRAADQAGAEVRAP